MIVATAGHVDHGKTHLIRALTGVDTDRLEEEKRRGMTIDLGFAYVDLGGQRPAGFIDVPGHERFVRTMAAGVHHLDLALLVVAADDGPMPQTREHLSLLKGLGLSEQAIVLTKIDRVDAAHRSRARNAALALLEGTPLASPPVFEVNTLDGEGIDALKASLGARQQAHDAQTRVPRGPARLAIDRAFSLPGAGLIVTGLLLDGQLAVGDELILSPRGEAVRVRGLRVHEQPASLAHAGTRCAVNLTGARSAAAELGRGDWLVAEALASTSERIDAVFTLNAEIDKPLTARA
ncbi:MAG: selenocysteine-specific translation elongation factor, partial [Burkholderiales bacterium]